MTMGSDLGRSTKFNPGNAKDLREYGRPVQRSWRLAVAMVGHVPWELIEPLDNESVYARFLAEKGGGVHHVAVAARNFDELLAMEARRGNEVVLSGEFEGVRVAYLGTDRDLGVTLEIFSGAPDIEDRTEEPLGWPKDETCSANERSQWRYAWQSGAW